MIRFYSANLAEPRCNLLEDEFQHCCTVLRRKVGDMVFLADGNGQEGEGIISSISKDSAQIEVTTLTQSSKPTSKLHLLVSPPKNRSRWEWLIEKSVELGVTSITALSTRRTERPKVNQERTEKIMRSAALQSLRPYHPSYKGLLSFKEVMELSAKTKQDKFIGHFVKDQVDLKDAATEHKASSILIGPEGDFTPEELEMAVKTGFSVVNISQHRLRTETAAVTSVVLLKSLGY